MAVMPIKSVRFGPQQLELIAEMADANGVSVSQYIRDAAFARAVMESAMSSRTDGYAHRLNEVLHRLRPE